MSGLRYELTLELGLGSGLELRIGLGLEWYLALRFSFLSIYTVEAAGGNILTVNKNVYSATIKFN